MKTSAKGKRPSRSVKKTTKVGNDTPAQLKAVLEKTAYNPLITPFNGNGGA